MNMTFTLRDYQHGAKDSTYKAWRDERCVLGVLPTGGGKTVVFADIIKDNLPGRTMVLAHRQELVFQAKDKIEKIAKCRVSVEMGDIKTDENQFEGFAEGMGRSDGQYKPKWRAATVVEGWVNLTPLILRF